ncbi:MAG: hypothetical protein GX591_03690 [Planctomycetes bacterium]|nr:hypothetical protein [Planctomycetota bacterium]
MKALTRLRQLASTDRRRPLRPPARWRRLRQFAWVAFITVLVWVWADLEQTTSQTIPVTLKVLPPPGSSMRVVQPTADGVLIYVTVRGAQGRITDLTRRLQEAETQGQDTACVVTADPNWEAAHSLDVLTALNQWDLLQRFNVTAVEASIETLPVTIDRWVEVAAQVQLRTSDDTAVQWDQMPQPPVQPATVRIRIPASRRADLEGNLVIATEPIDVSGLPTGEEVTRTVALQKSIDGVPVQFVEEPSNVRATLVVGSRTSTRTIRVPVNLLVDPVLMERITRDRYVLSRDANRPDEWEIQVTLSGSRKRLDQVSATPSLVTAFAKVNDVDLEPNDTHPARPVEILLPEGVTLVEPQAASVHFKYVQAPPQP